MECDKVQDMSLEALLEEMENECIASEEPEPESQKTKDAPAERETLAKRLREMDEQDFVYLGCKSGSGWMFIGTVAELRLNLYRLNSMYIKANLTAIRKRKIAIAGHEKSLKVLSAKIENACGELATITNPSDFWKKLNEIQGHEKDRKRVEKAKQDAEKSLSKAYENIFGWVKFEKRTIAEEYHKDLVPPAGTAILLPGDCSGKYWTYDEVLCDKDGMTDLDKK